jgi:hypothetical protein
MAKIMVSTMKSSLVVVFLATTSALVIVCPRAAALSPQSKGRHAIQVPTRYIMSNNQRYRTSIVSLAANKRNPKQNDDDYYNHDKDTNRFMAKLDNLGWIADTPTPLVPNLPLGYPLAFLLVTIVFSPPVAVLLVWILLFGIFRTLGGIFTTIEEEGEHDIMEEASSSTAPINLLAFVAALLCSLLLLPTASTVAPPSPGVADVVATLGILPQVVISGIAAVVLVSGGWQDVLLNTDKDDPPRVISSPEQERMELWDDELKRAATKTKRKPQDGVDE